MGPGRSAERKRDSAQPQDAERKRDSAQPQDAERKRDSAQPQEIDRPYSGNPEVNTLRNAVNFSDHSVRRRTISPMPPNSVGDIGGSAGTDDQRVHEEPLAIGAGIKSMVGRVREACQE